ncbi:helix-turn-helix domain-containing protein [uncultured Tateyamaria sp.]|uniref:helix-turn-helix domain-containing protein n=1 Tax=uncultured Tateyamaria sp. TaxID=455651 RepID=UPI00261BD7A9|nr:helix-turn-helix domain-containing protein [uncultured Tateyamaria sp.]
MPLLTPEQCRARRQARGLSQAELSRLSGPTENYVCRFEGGEIANPSAKRLNAIQEALEATPIHPSVVQEVLAEGTTAAGEGE